MAKKTAQIDIKLTGLNSIDKLEKELRDVNEQIKLVDVNSKEFEVLQQRAQAADSKLRTVSDSLKGLTSQQQATAIKDMGMGLVGAFQIAASASLIFGEQTSEAIEKAQAKVVALFNAVDGFEKVMKMFTGDSLKMFQNVGKGFKSLVVSAKGASMGIKAALVSTGIGALVVGVGLLIANFDKLKKLFSDNKQSKALEESLEINQRYSEVYKAVADAAEKSVKYQKQIAEITGSNKLAAEAEVTALNEKHKALLAERDVQKDLLDIQQAIVTEFTGREFKDEYKAASKEVVILTANVSDLNAQIILTQQYELEVAKQYKEIVDIVDAVKIKLVENEKQLIKIQSLQYNQRALYENQLENLKLRKEELEAYKNTEKGLNYIQVQQYEIILEQIDALSRQENLRVKQLKEQIESLNISRDFEKLLDKINAKYTIIATAAEMASGSLEANVKLFEDEIAMLEIQKSQFDDLFEKKKNLINFDEKGKGLLYLQNKELEEQLLNYNELFSEARGILDLQVEYVSERIKEGKITGKLYDEKLDAAARELMFFTQIEEATQRKLANDKQILETQKNNLELRQEELNEIGQVYEAQKLVAKSALEKAQNELKNATSLEAQAAALQKVQAAEQQVATANQNVLNTNLQIYEVKSDIAQVNNDIVTKEQEIQASTQAVLDKQKELSDEVERGAQGYALAQEQSEKYAEEIAAVQQLISASFEMVAAQYDRQAKKAEQNLKKLNKELAKLERRENKIKELKEELKDADGERYDQLLQLIAEEEQAETSKNQSIEEQRLAIEAAMKEAENKKMEAEYQAAKWRKVQAIVDATIAGALAVVRALPNVVLAAIVGVLSAEGIATIAAQKLPERPPKQELGGYQRGKSHAQGGIPVEVEGGEYVINKRSTAQYLPVLEAINEMGNRRKFADGGLTAPVNTKSNGDLIDYERLAKAVLDGIQPTVSVVEINRMQQRVKVLEAKARLGK